MGAVDDENSVSISAMRDRACMRVEDEQRQQQAEMIEAGADAAGGLQRLPSLALVKNQRMLAASISMFARRA